jgi:hypothetical protein
MSCNSNCSCSKCKVVNLPYTQGPRGNPGQDGTNGAQGPQGNPGPPNTLTIGTVTSDPVAAASITGTSPNQVLNLVLPTGATGPAGPAGPTGANGGILFQNITLPGYNASEDVLGSPDYLFGWTEVSYSDTLGTFLTTADSIVNWFGYPIMIYPGVLNSRIPTKLKLLVATNDVGYVGKIEIKELTSGKYWLEGGDPGGAPTDPYVLITPGITTPTIIDLTEYLCNGVSFNTFWGITMPNNISNTEDIIQIKVIADATSSSVGDPSKKMAWMSLLIEY